MAKNIKNKTTGAVHSMRSANDTAPKCGLDGGWYNKSNWEETTEEVTCLVCRKKLGLVSSRNKDISISLVDTNKFKPIIVTLTIHSEEVFKQMRRGEYGAIILELKEALDK